MSQTEHTFESIFDIGDSMISDCEQQYDTDTENLTSSSISWVCQFEDEIGSSLDDMQFIITDKVIAINFIKKVFKLSLFLLFSESM